MTRTWRTRATDVTLAREDKSCANCLGRARLELGDYAYCRHHAAKFLSLCLDDLLQEARRERV